MEEMITKTFALLLGLFVFLFNVIKILLVPTKRAVQDIIASFVIGFPSGVLVGLLCKEFELGDMSSITIACMTVLIAEKIALTCMRLDVGKALQRALDNLIDKHTK